MQKPMVPFKTCVLNKNNLPREPNADAFLDTALRKGEFGGKAIGVDVMGV